VSRTWALVLSAAILYVPANVFPVMTVVYFGRGAPDTIISGVIELLHGGLWPLALLVFVASIMVPVLNGHAKVPVKPETQSGTVVRLKGKGFAVYKQEGRVGDLLVTYTVKVPEHLTEKQKELFRQLRDT